MKNTLRLFVAALISLALIAGCSAYTAQRDTLYQVSVIDALLAGVYDGDVNVGTLKKRGDFGLGTFEALDGEMVVLDGEVYRVSSDGNASVAPDEVNIPFAAVAFFKEDFSFESTGDKMDYAALKKLIDSRLVTKNAFYAIKIEGNFGYIKTRSVFRQKKPYPPLTAALKNQPIFEFENVGGTIVGFRCPDYVTGINVPGYHFHFLTDDKTAGGHVLEMKTGDINIKIDRIDAFYMNLPREGGFHGLNFGESNSSDLDSVE